MEKLLYLANTESDGSLAKAALECLSVVKNLGADFDIALFGENVQPAADAIAGAGAGKIYGVSDAALAQPRYATDAAAAQALIEAAGAAIVLAPGNSRIQRILPGVSRRLGGVVDLHATKVEANGDQPKIVRWYYRQRMEANQTRAKSPWLISVDPGAALAYEGPAGSASVEAVSASLPASRSKVIGLESPTTGEQTIRPDAELLFVAGAGWTKKQADGNVHTKEAEGIISDFIKQAGASLGSSKSLVDLSGEGQDVMRILTHLNQVGQTGSTPRHPKGLATCCHGEEPHVVGWRFINERRAINLDANCGWAQGKADVVYIGDAFEIMRKVQEML